MTTAVQHRRGTTAEHSTFTGLEGEVTIDTTKDTAVIHDGSLAGGYPLAKETLANVNPSTLSAITGAATASDDLFLMYDTSALSMKKISRAELNNAITIEALDTVDINGGTIDGTTIGGTTPADGSFTTLTTSGTVTHSGGTANGVTYLNGSKVLTSGSALTFDGTTFNVSSIYTRITQTAAGSDAILDMYGQSSNRGAQIRSFGADGSAQYLIFKNGNTEAMRLTSTGLGIGTSSPTNILSVAGSANITGNTTLGDASTDTVTVNGYMGVGTSGSASYGINIDASNRTGTATRGIVINTIIPATSTSSYYGVRPIASTAAASFTLANAGSFYAGNFSAGAGSTITNLYGLLIDDLTGATNNYGITSAVSSGTNKWNIYASGTAANYFAGNVGIGTSSPQKQLEVKGSSATSEIRLSNSTAVYSNIYSDSNGILILAADGGGTGGAASMRMSVSGSERLRIDSSGNVGIGTSSPGDKIELGGNGSGIIIRSPNGTRYRLTVTDVGVLSIAAA